MNVAFGGHDFSSSLMQWFPAVIDAMPKEELEQLREELRRQRELQEAMNSFFFPKSI